MRHKNGYGISLRRWACGALLAVLSLSVQAFNADRYTDLEWSTSGDKARFVPKQSPTPVTRTPASFGSAAGGPTLQGTRKLPWPGKAQATNMAKWKAMAQPRDMAKAIVNPIGMLGGFAATLAITTLLDTACTRVFGGSMTLAPGAQWEECKFTTQTVYADRTWYNGYVGYPFFLGSAQEACGGYTAGVHPGSPSDPYKFGCYSGQTAVQSGYQMWTCIPEGGGSRYQVGGAIDAGNDVPISCGYSATVRDVNDPWQPATGQQAEDALTEAIEAQLAADYAACPEGCSRPTQQVLADLVEAWRVELGSPYASGPADYTDAPRVTTQNVIQSTPTGTTTATLTTTEIDKYTFSYDGDSVTTTKTTTKTEDSNTSEGQVTTTTTTEAEAADPKEDQRSECDKNPKAAGCAELDVPIGEIPTRTETISWNPVDLGFGGGACPAPFAWSDSLGSHSLNLQSYCDVVTSVIRPVVLAFALLAAYFIVAGVRME